MKFSIRTLLVLTAVIALALGWLAHSLSSLRIDFQSNGNEITFSNVQFRDAAETLSFDFEFEFLIVTVDGIRGPHLTPEDKTARFNIKVKGKTQRSLTSLKPIWPFTDEEFSATIENELEQRLGADSDPKFFRSTFPMGRYGR